MKAPRGGGARRVKDPEVSTEQLFDKLRNHVKDFTIAASAFDLHAYNAMDISHAANGKPLLEIIDLLKILLAVSPLGKIPYSSFKPHV